MLAKRIIPCLDVENGRVVKGVNFLNLRDAGDPVAIAKRYEDEGADELVFLDITASHEQRDIILDIVGKTADQIFMPLTVGGGVRTIDDFHEGFDFDHFFVEEYEFELPPEIGPTSAGGEAHGG